MNVLTTEQQIEVLQLLKEGNSLSGTHRLTKVHRDTCTRLMVWFGNNCKRFLRQEMHNLTLRHVQVDELWTFVQKKEARCTAEEKAEGRTGDIYTFIALDHDTKLVPTFLVGRRDGAHTEMFIRNLARTLRKPIPHDSDRHAYQRQRIRPIVQISSDGWEPYWPAIDMHFARYADYAMVIKDKKAKGQDGKPTMDVTKKIFTGEMKMNTISTSLVERNNLTIRTFVKRMVRKSICFSKKIENLEAAIAFYVATYNYCWKHKTLGTSPAHEAGLAPHLYSFPEFFAKIQEISPWNGKV